MNDWHCTRRPERTLVVALAVLLIGAALAAIPSTANANCESPRQSVRTLIDNVQPDRHEPQFAAKCFDWSGFRGSEERRHELAVHLKEVLDARGLWVYYEKIPDDPDYEDELGKNEFVLFPDDLPNVYLHKKGGSWLFHPSTVRRTPQLYDETFAIGLQRYASKLPPLFHTTFVGVSVWQYLAIVILAMLVLLLGRIAAAVIVHLVRRLPRAKTLTWLREALGETQWPVALLVASLLALPLIRELGLSVQFTKGMTVMAKTIGVAAVVMMLWRLVDVFGRALARRAAATDSKLDDQLVPLVRKLLKIVFGVLALIFILQNLDVDVGSLIAGLGLGGLAFALAAKDTLANLFGSLTIFLDRPFQIGDWIKFPGVEGTVEEVGFRSTRVRTFHKSIVTVPNSKIADAVIDNLGVRDYRRLKFTVGLTYDSTPEQIRAMVEGIRAILQNNDRVWQEYYEVHFVEFGASSLNIMVYAFLDVDSWTEELKQKQNIMLEVMVLARKVGVGFAFPTQSLHIESDPSSKTPHTAPSKDELEDVVASFAAGGDSAHSFYGSMTGDGYFPQTTRDRGSGEDG